MKRLVWVVVLLGLLVTRPADAQCTAPGCELATAVVSNARATARAILTAEAPPTPTPVPTSTPWPTPTPTAEPTATATATAQPTDTPEPTATATAQPTAAQPVATVMVQGDQNANPSNWLLNIVIAVVAALLIYVSLSSLLRRIPTWRK